MERVLFTLPEDSWHGYGTESLWAEPLSDGGYRISSVPFFVNGISFDDIVSAKRSESGLVFEAVLGRGGHSTYRIAAGEGDLPDSRLQALAAAGCSWEEGPGGMVTLDVSADADIHAVFELLETGFAAGSWEFEEAHVGHALRVD